ncbi:NusG domain II-containing protein [Oceanotoga teriensis]|uniref:NusG domain II-containing protein n=1 Tax=Oceanotoga teriensis TaxID=515440 RepID=UPI002713F870|nr:NusG domain II-containing protein [Oceanotoga teriensis]MDO7976720.1 NusG domain II-containing protein [Oceanotoga teriensis]
MKLINKKDIIIIIGIIIISLVFILINKSDKKIKGADVYIKNEKVMEITKEGTYTLFDENEIPIMKIEYLNQKIRAVESNCPLQICVNMGWVDSPNHEIICIPNKVIIKPIGKDETGVDLLTW